jgi:hypothetical protein
MGMPTDVELDSSTSTLENDYAQPAVDTVAESDDGNEAATAGSGEDEGTQSDSPAADSHKQPKSSDRAKNSLEKALEHLTKKSSKSDEEKPDVTATKKAEAKAPVKTDAKPKQEAKKDASKAVDEPTADELRAMPDRTRQRFEKLLSERKTTKEAYEKTTAEYEAAKPDIEKGKAFSGLVEEFGLAEDLNSSGDEDIAGAIIFQAALARLVSGKGTKTDLEQIQRQAVNLGATLDKIGVSFGNKAPAVDAEKLSAALDKAESELEFGDLRKLLAEMKPEPTKATPPQPVAKVQLVDERPAQRNEQRPQAAVPNDVDDGYYINKAVQAIKADGVTDTKSYFDKTLFPRILSDLKAAYPGSNPADVFGRLSPQAKHDATIGAHAAIRKQSASLKAPPMKPAPQQRPSAAGGTRPSWQRTGGTAHSANAAVNFLAGD